jgi:hypothetical protein
MTRLSGGSTVADEPSSDSAWVEFDRVRWIRDHLPPESADVLIALISEDGGR